jgi:hypothetical protein
MLSIGKALGLPEGLLYCSGEVTSGEPLFTKKCEFSFYIGQPDIEFNAKSLARLYSNNLILIPPG